MQRYKIVKADSVMGMGDEVYSILSTVSQQHIAYINEKAQVLFTKPVNLNIAQEVIELAIQREKTIS